MIPLQQVEIPRPKKIPADNPLDAAGNPLCEGAILKVKHFIGSRGRKHYMYKQVLKVTGDFIEIAHLPIRDTPKKGYGHRGNMDDSLVIACYCSYHIHHNLKLHKEFRQ